MSILNVLPVSLSHSLLLAVIEVISTGILFFSVIEIVTYFVTPHICFSVPVNVTLSVLANPCG